MAMNSAEMSSVETTGMYESGSEPVMSAAATGKTREPPSRQLFRFCLLQIALPFDCSLQF